jgi:hypothetical protein
MGITHCGDKIMPPSREIQIIRNGMTNDNLRETFYNPEPRLFTFNEQVEEIPNSVGCNPDIDGFWLTK